MLSVVPVVRRQIHTGIELMTGADDGETAAIIMSLRQKLKAQTDEVASLNAKLSSLNKENEEEVRCLHKQLF